MMMIYMSNDHIGHQALCLSYLNLDLSICKEYFKNFDIIWDVQGVSE